MGVRYVPLNGCCSLEVCRGDQTGRIQSARPTLKDEDAILSAIRLAFVTLPPTLVPQSSTGYMQHECQVVHVSKQTYALLKGGQLPFRR